MEVDIGSPFDVSFHVVSGTAIATNSGDSYGTLFAIII